MATLAVGHARGLSFEQMAAAALRLRAAHRTAANLSGRLAASITSTTPRRRISTRWKKRSSAQTKPVVLIAGGKDKGFDFRVARAARERKSARAVLDRRDGGADRRRTGTGVTQCEIAHFARRRGRARSRGRETGRRCPVFSRHFLFRHVQKLRRSRRSIPRPRARPAENENENVPKPILSQTKKTARDHATAAARLPATADYEEMSEPNMKLSRALLIVLVLHVVAVAGIIAFNAIKPQPPAGRTASSQHSSHRDCRRRAIPRT